MSRRTSTPVTDVNDLSQSGDFLTFMDKPQHTHTYNVVTTWDHHSGKYSGILDYSVALEVMCSGCLERKSLEATV